MTLDELLLQLRRRRLILISESEIWPSPLFTQEIEKALRRHRKGLRVLLRYSEIAVCPAKDLHRQFWRRDRDGYVCEMCQRLQKWIGDHAA